CTTTSWPASTSSSAADSPASPPPTTATFTGRAPGRRRLRPGGARLRRRLTTLLAALRARAWALCAGGACPYSTYCPARHPLGSFPSAAPGARPEAGPHDPELRQRRQVRR